MRLLECCAMSFRKRHIGTFARIALLILVCVGIALAFAPPDAEQRRDAVGSVQDLSMMMQRALEPAGHFEPIPKPGKRDWLAVHDEPGQTFRQFVKYKPNKPTKERHKIYLQPLGDFDEGAGPSLERLKQFTAAFFVMPVEVSEPIHLDGAGITTCTNTYTRKTQLLSTDILDLLKQRLPEDAFCVVGVTMTDLYPEPSWNFVFGQASLRERVGVYSFARYDPRFHGRKPPADVEALVLRRSCKVLAHETGHMFGITHCTFFSCLMNGSNHMTESDRSPAHLCPVDLRKLQHSVGFDVVDRYRKLRAFWQEAGWVEETKWLTDRLGHIDPDSVGE